MNRRLLIVFAILYGCLFVAIIGCSHGYKTGMAITSADLIKALPEFTVALPSGGTNLYLEHNSRRPINDTWYKVSVPTATLTNFLHGFGFADEFIVTTAQMIRMQDRVQLPQSMNTRDVVSLAVSTTRQAHHAAEWDLNKATGPVRMYLAARPGISSPNDQVFLFGYVAEPTTSNVTAYLEYHCLHK